MMKLDLDEVAASSTGTSATNRRIRQGAWIVIALVVTFIVGLGSGYLRWGRDETVERKQQNELANLYKQVNPAEGYSLSIPYGDLGPQLVEAGVIDYDALIQAMSASGDAISNRQLDILKNGSDEKIVITAENAHFLLNFFWAVGLANKNSILTNGMMTQYSNGQVERFASTGGWTLATKPVTDIYASLDLIPLTAEQQAHVEEVAAAVYRPCCNNSTLFPDCNHGMAMLGLLEWMASRGATVNEMFEAAKYFNAFWFPQQNIEIAMVLKTSQNLDFEDADPRLVVSEQFSSGSGAAVVHQQLQANGALPKVPNQGGSCAN